jgi:DNA-3-methyladenine glycosylase I
MTETQQDTQARCAWVTQDPLYVHYHDHEWGIPIYDEQLLFEFLILEGAQAGLNWLTVLKKRENYRLCFDGFNADKMARYGNNEIEALLTDARIIRNKLKIVSAIENAKAYLNIREKKGSFKDYIWQFVDGKPIKNHWKSHQQVPCRTSLSDSMSKDLKGKGFKFVGSTICYAYMQAVGMVNDHVMSCFRYARS